MDKRFWAIIGVIILIFGGVIFFNQKKDNQSGSSSAAKSTNHVIGNTTNAKVTLLEYGDFQCPVCEGYYPVVKEVQTKYNDTVKFQFRNLPLLQIHQNAFAAARAAEAADLQGKYWEMHDTLYAQQNWSEWTQSTSPLTFFKQYATNLKLDVNKFATDFASSAVNDRINADMAAFDKTGQQKSTPTFFINGKYYANSNFVDSTGQPSVDAFTKVIDEALKNAK